MSVSQEIGAKWEVFTDLLYSDRDFVAADNRGGSTITIPETNAYRTLNNLFPGQGNIRMTYNFTDDLGPALAVGDAKTRSGTAGATLDISTSWNVDIVATYADFTEAFVLPNRVDNAALTTALASSDRAMAFNPFADGSNTNAAVLAGLHASVEQGSDTVIRSVSAKANGTFFDLPGGPARLAVGGELREERFDFTSIDVSAAGVRTPSNFLEPGRRTVRATFAEVYVPIMDEPNRRPGFHLLDVSLAARHENYTDVGETTNPRVGLRWVPIDGLMLRGSYGTSFKAPFLRDLTRPSFAFTALSTATDPFATGGSTFTLVRLGGNPNLVPEEAVSRTFAVQYSPPGVESLAIGATYFNITFEDRVGTFSSTRDVFTNPELFPGLLIRNPTQAQVDALLGGVDTVIGVPPAPGSVEAILDSSLTNLTAVKVDGIDLNVRYRASGSISTTDFSIDGSYLLSFDEKFSSAAPVSENVDRLGKPVDLRIRGAVTWSRGGLGVSGFINYVDEYDDRVSIPNRTVGSWATMDLQLRYTAAEQSGGWLKDTAATLSVVNLLDKDPPFANQAPGFGFDPANANPLGRLIALDISHKW